jgi:hypothetical protein
VVDLVVLPGFFEDKPIEVVRIQIPATEPEPTREADADPDHLEPGPGADEPDDDIPV